MHFKLWTLNNATDLLAEKHGKEIIHAIESRNIFTDHFRKLPKVTMGKRETLYLNDTPISNPSPYQFMPQIEQCDVVYDEYFVPIPVKCIGSLFDSEDFKRQYKRTAPEYKLLELIKKTALQDKQKSYKDFWTEDPDLNRARMLTPQFKGYYQLLDEASEGGKYRHIIVGYSQGGLVTRFLAFLDEYVFKKNIIHSIITVSSPNFGSPLANELNRNDISKAIVRILNSISSINTPYFTNLLRYQTENIDYEEINEFVQGGIEGFTQMQKNGNPREKDAANESLNFLYSLKKWLGGMRDDPNNAFYDLKITHLKNDPHKKAHVLNLVNHPDYQLKRINYAALVGTNSSTNDALGSLTKGKLLFSLGKIVLEQQYLFGTKIKDNFKTVDELYKYLMMVEYSEIEKRDILNNFKNIIIKQNTPETIRSVLESYIKGASVQTGKGKIQNIPKLSHDFVIPSVCQCWPKHDSNDANNFGVYVNPKANHNSGKSRLYEGGQINFSILKKVLRMMSRS